MSRAGFDVAVVGGGIVGLATGLALLARRPGLRLAVLEKEAAVGTHQTGHNSGVIHAGIYYRPGSLKARLCVEGARKLFRFCEARGIPWQRPGKVVVATRPEQVPVLEELLRRGQANGVRGLRLLGPAELHEREPHAAGLAALLSPDTGTVDFGAVARAMAAELARLGAAIRTRAPVTAIARTGRELRLTTPAGELAARHLVNCAGLHADAVARLAGAEPRVRILPFRGEYYRLRPERRNLVRGLIYPVPDPRFPFLGVHFTRTARGEVEAGPNAVLALAREGYSRGTVRPAELWEILAYPGLHRLVRRYWRAGLAEAYRSLCKRAFTRSLQELVPAVGPHDLLPGGAGVRAQAVTRCGALLDDFHVVTAPQAVHVLNAPSPAATASLAIGEHVAGLAHRAFALGGRT